jgi:hypothetical protein
MVTPNAHAHTNAAESIVFAKERSLFMFNPYVVGRYSRISLRHRLPLSLGGFSLTGPPGHPLGAARAHVGRSGDNSGCA